MHLSYILRMGFGIIQLKQWKFNLLFYSVGPIFAILDGIPVWPIQHQCINLLAFSFKFPMLWFLFEKSFDNFHFIFSDNLNEHIKINPVEWTINTWFCSELQLLTNNFYFIYSIFLHHIKNFNFFLHSTFFRFSRWNLNSKDVRWIAWFHKFIKFWINIRLNIS